jgi:Ca2+:H+ antiporter
LKFILQEKPVLIALAAVVATHLFHDFFFVNNTITFTVILFFAVFAIIINAAFSVVHHAEVLAVKFGEPYGTMILTFSAVTVEIIMISAMMLHGDKDPALARDTIFSTLMILINGLIGLTMLSGGIKYGEQFFNFKGSTSFLSTILIILGIGMFLPNLIEPAAIRQYEIFTIVICFLLYGFFLRMQSKEHSYFFSYHKEGGHREEEHHEELKKENGWYHTILLVFTITLISLLAEDLSVAVDETIAVSGLPAGVAGLIISLIIVSPEGLTAIRAGMKNDMQRAINISLGSSLSTVTLTIPAVLIVGLMTGHEVLLGLTPIQSGMIIISLLIGLLSTTRGETNAMQGFIHFVLFITFVFLIFM